MKRIGLTGGLASGKSTVAQMFVEHGIALISADQIVHAVYAADRALCAQIARTFGPTVVTATGTIDRQRLGDRIFSDAKARQILEGMVHPLVRQQIAEATQHLEKNGVAMCLCDIPLLFESQFNWHFDAIIVVGCKPETQIQRVMARYRYDRTRAMQRIACQLPLADKMSRADYVIDTDELLEHTRQRVAEILTILHARPAE